MKIFTNKEYENRIKWARESVESEYKMKAITLDLIGALLGQDFSTMTPKELEEFFNFHPNSDAQMINFIRGMKAGIDSIIKIFEQCGIARKRTLEKLRFRSLKKMDNYIEEYKQKIDGEAADGGKQND